MIKKCLIIFLIGIELLCIHFMIYTKSHQNVEYINKLDNESKYLTFFIEKEPAGSRNYEKSSNNKWPNEDEYKFARADCYDASGPVSNVLKFENNKAILNTDRETYCWLYFDINNSDFIFYLGGNTNPSYALDSKTSVYLKWNDSTITHYCIKSSPTSTCSSSDWVAFTSSERSNLEATKTNFTLSGSDGLKTYYVYLKSSSSITEYVSDDITLDTQDPTCQLKVTNNGIEFNYARDNLSLANQGIGLSATPSYGTNKYDLKTGTYYGFVKDAAGRTGTCRATVFEKTYQSGGTRTCYSYTSQVCQKTGSTTASYYCCKAANSSSGNCPSGYSSIGGYCAKDASSPTCSSGTYSESSGMCRSYSSFVCPDGYVDGGSTCYKTTSASSHNYGSSSLCQINCGVQYNEGGHGASCSGSTCYYCTSGTLSGTSCRTDTKSKDSCPSGYNKASNQCWKNVGSPTCGSKTLINGSCYTTTSASTTYSCSNSSDSLSGTQCCRTSTSSLSGYSCSSSGSSDTYGFTSPSSNTGCNSYCPGSSFSCDASHVGQTSYNCTSTTETLPGGYGCSYGSEVGSLCYSLS